MRQRVNVTFARRRKQLVRLGRNRPSSLIISGAQLYGTTSVGANGSGTIFVLNKDGSGFRTLYKFTQTHGTGIAEANADGAQPSGLLLSSNTLFGFAYGGGSDGNGTVFGINFDGSGFRRLYSFAPFSADPFFFGTANADGAGPSGSPRLVGSTLYGVTTSGGTNGQGAIFQINVSGSGFTNLHSFTGDDGAGPEGGLIQAGNTLYGTTPQGGAAKAGTVFALVLAPDSIPLNFQVFNSSLMLSWSQPAFTLQSAPNPDGPFTNIIGATSPHPIDMSEVHQFFRLYVQP